MTLIFGSFPSMGKLSNHIADFTFQVIGFLARPYIYEVSQKRLLTRLELAIYFGRSTSWVRDRIDKGGVLMINIHFYDFCGVILYNREQIEADIISGSI